MDENQYEAELQRKISILQQEFEEIDRNYDSLITKEELCAYLDRKSGTEFDRNVADELFEQMDIDHNGRVTVEEFIRVYVEADRMLHKKVEIAKINKENFKRQQEECLKKAQEERENEHLGRNRGPHPSAVNVTVISANLPYLNSNRKIFVELSFKNYEPAYTDPVAGRREITWNQKLMIDGIMEQEGILSLKVFEYIDNNNYLLEGETEIDIQDLGDQNIHDIILDLFDRRQENKGTLHVKPQWIHSKVEYFEMVAQRWYDCYQKEDEELQEYEKILESLYQPFPNLKGVSNNTQNRASVFATPAIVDKKFLELMNDAAKSLANEREPSGGFWAKITTIACLVEIVIAIFLAFGRASFFDLLSSLLVLLYFRSDAARNTLSLKALGLSILVSILLVDCIWLANYSGVTFIDSRNLTVKELDQSRSL